MIESNSGSEHASAPSSLASRLNAAGWGLFFVWLGIVFLGNFTFGVTMLGIAAVTLGMQGVRKLFALPFEGFWLFVGLVFLLGGVWDYLNPRLPLAAVVFFILGALLLAQVMKRR